MYTLVHVNLLGFRRPPQILHVPSRSTLTPLSRWPSQQHIRCLLDASLETSNPATNAMLYQDGHCMCSQLTLHPPTPRSASGMALTLSSLRSRPCSSAGLALSNPSNSLLYDVAIAQRSTTNLSITCDALQVGLNQLCVV